MACLIGGQTNFIVNSTNNANVIVCPMMVALIPTAISYGWMERNVVGGG